MEIKELVPADFKSDQMVRWCAGCGDHAILNSIQKALPRLGIKHEDFAFISGIGCSSRFPYYMNTYGFHGIHGRAAAIASGVKTANPELSVWVITGDGDSLAIGGNHFIHLIRRNVDLNLILFNNQIYGLTKGQYSPTSEHGTVTKTSPLGTVERPFKPGALAIGARGTFFARTIDVMTKLSTEIYVKAAQHKGTSIVEVLQNCVIFSDKVWADISDRKYRDDRVIVLENDQPMIYGKDRDKGLMLKDGGLLPVQIEKNGVTEDDLLVHDSHNPFAGLHVALANMEYPDFPVALGVIRDCQETASYETAVANQIKEAQSQAKSKSIKEIMLSGSTWEVK
ncbi:MAG: 2-oxoacid:ferredoxin oxidoreductase subunit beta [Bacteroidetes bacterium]|jgi:2-oxoglutarate/2-oxoacid ferredoxin oxidoreductase subunit beta|nr:2-oxoacid:ferredoxin oxidoreductase subunit beta [Bacteroidota bacterium]MBT3751631.1 2-oxoacid:ferredoxin oxidoreductase subunit beta [Bacteroidota bacterium]MBT4399470.1 2-oxoacid:ferredoxin oxidoreductase subunit beta [Bacteroidota bacterium]MBT4409990.1 2-oxoacid:ferredoxin oxidoreductase subunit beta [Bacteroidota bacterium]MBT7092469.1 2-oxoacid:ferredoxin oxidoreductase subunit beta [Bacteroidota bacterium]